MRMDAVAGSVGGRWSVVTTKQYLSRAYWLRKRIAAKQIRLEELRTRAEHITPTLSGLPHGGGTSDPTAASATQIADLDWEIQLDLLDLIQYEDQIAKAIESVEDPNAYQVLYYRYLAYKSWREIAELMHYTPRHLRRIHLRALTLVDVVLECPIDPVIPLHCEE